MINMLGNSPVSSIKTAGINEFLSILRPKASRAFGGDPGRYSRAYSSFRGLLISKEYVKGPHTDTSKGYQFQFNPREISDVKDVLYSRRQYTGLDYGDYVWGGGGERIVSFQLFLDNTPQSKTHLFRPQSVNDSKLAQNIKLEGNGFTYDSEGRLTGTGDRSYFGKGLVDEIVSQGRTYANQFKATFMPSAGPSKFMWENPGGAYSTTRINERGILDEVEMIQSFLHPAPLKEGETPLFASGGIVSSEQFRPPVTAVFVFGPLCMEGIIKAAPTKYTLFDADLTPLRATIDVEFCVFEYEEVSGPYNNMK